MAQCVAGAVEAFSRALAAQEGFAGSGHHATRGVRHSSASKPGWHVRETKSLTQETDDFKGWDKMIWDTVAPSFGRAGGLPRGSKQGSWELSGQQVGLTVIDRNRLPSRTRARNFS